MKRVTTVQPGGRSPSAASFSTTSSVDARAMSPWTFVLVREVSSASGGWYSGLPLTQIFRLHPAVAASAAAQRAHFRSVRTRVLLVTSEARGSGGAVDRCAVLIETR